MVKVYRWKEKDVYTVDDLIGIMRVLRGENGCPWDREQTHTSIRNNLLEEAYETVDAIDRLDDTDMVEELGDLLLQIVFHCQMAEERGAYNLNDVADGICKKLIYRHPHIFSNVVAKTSDEVLNNWDNLQKKEKHMTSYSDTLKAVPKSFPACMRAQKIQKRASKAGYDFDSVSDTVTKIEEELAELKEAISNKDKNTAAAELGDLLFSVINTARHLKVDAEEQLSASTERFISRFSLAEDLAVADNLDLADLSNEERDVLWERSKELSNQLYYLLSIRLEPVEKYIITEETQMNKTELITAIADKAGIAKQDADKALTAFVEVVTDELKAGGKVQLVGFGTFEVKERAARTGINPQTKAQIQIPASKAPVFKAGNTFKSEIK